MGVHADAAEIPARRLFFRGAAIGDGRATRRTGRGGLATPVVRALRAGVVGALGCRKVGMGVHTCVAEFLRAGCLSRGVAIGDGRMAL